MAYLATTIFLSLPLIANLLFLRHTAETWTFKEIIQRQRQMNAVYGSALVDNTFRYKLELIRAVKPEIVALGSSKTMLLQEQAFYVPFVNAGGGMHHLNEGILFLTEMVKFHQPKILVLGVDFFWFNGTHPEQVDYPEHDLNETDITRDKLLAPFRWLVSGKISRAMYWDGVLGRHYENPFTRYENLGVAAMDGSFGFLRDGSRLYGKRYFGEDKNLIDKKFEFALSNFNNACCEFEYGAHVDEYRWGEFEKIINLCKTHGIQPVLLMTPTSLTLYKKMDAIKNKYAYIEELKTRLEVFAKRNGFEFHDFRNLETVSSNDCECLDGTHAGNVAYNKMLQWILTQCPRSILAPYLNEPFIANAIRQFNGNTLVMPDPNQFKLNETDFLEIGCQKKPVFASGATQYSHL